VIVYLQVIARRKRPGVKLHRPRKLIVFVLWDVVQNCTNFREECYLIGNLRAEVSVFVLSDASTVGMSVETVRVFV